MLKIFTTMILFIAMYEVSKVIYPDFDIVERKIVRRLKEKPVLQLSPETVGEAIEVSPGQKVVYDGKIVFYRKLDAAYWVYTIIQLVYFLALIVGILSGNPAIAVSTLCILIMGSIMSKVDVTKSSIRIDSLLTLGILIPMIYYLF